MDSNHRYPPNRIRPRLAAVRVTRGSKDRSRRKPVRLVIRANRLCIPCRPAPFSQAVSARGACRSRYSNSFRSRPGLVSLSDRGSLFRSCRLRRVELATPFFDAAGPLVPGDGGTDMVRASALAYRSDFPLRLAGCQGKDLTAEVGRAKLAASCSCGRSARAPTWSRWGGRLGCHGRRFG